jgi:flagellar hook-associated protein 2
MSSTAQSLNSQIAREVQIASLPIQILQNSVNDLTAQSNELQTLNSNMQALQSAIAGIASLTGNLLSASVSNPSVATAAASSTAAAGTYSLAVTNLGSYSYAVSGDGLPVVTDPTQQSISNSSSYTLTVNGQMIPITVSGNSLNALAQAITASGAGVQASVIQVGTDAVSEYRLSLQSEEYGPVTMQLNDGTQDLLQQPSGDLGQAVQYSVNGQAVSSGSRTVTLAAGLTVNLTGTTSSGAPTTVTVAPDSSSIGNAMQSFVNAYNQAVTELSKNRGQAGGALTGQNIISQLTFSLQHLATYQSGSGAISSLAALGLTFADGTGMLSFDQSTFDSATSGQAPALQQFLGSATGGGFLQAATNLLNSIEDPVTGSLTTGISNVQSQINNTNTQISDKQAKVSQLQQNLTQQMAAADAMIYSLQQQASYFQQMFATQNASKMAGLL